MTYRLGNRGRAKVVAGHLDAGPVVTLDIRGHQGGARASERVEDAAALLADPHKLTHEVGRLSERRRACRRWRMAGQ